MVRKLLLLTFLLPLYSQIGAQENLECRLSLKPLDFVCLDQAALEREQKRREDVYVPESQIEVFRRLEDKEKELEIATRDRNEKLVELRIVEERIERKLNELRKAREELDEARKQRLEIEGQDIAKIVSYYERMEPENAANFINLMDLLTAAQILMRMNPRKGAAVMELVEPEVAVKITERVALFKEKLEEAAFFQNPNRTLPNTN